MLSDSNVPVIEFVEKSEYMTDLSFGSTSFECRDNSMSYKGVDLSIKLANLGVKSTDLNLQTSLG